MLKLTPFLLVILLQVSINAQPSWFQLFQLQNARLNQIRFTDSLTGYHCSDYSNGFIGFGNLSKSTNGGLNWFSVYSGNPVYSVFFLNNQTGWFTAGYWDDALRKSREIYKTTNGGINFTRQFLDSISGILSGIQFTDVNSGYCISGNGRLFSTSNSGNNWVISDSLTQGITKLYFVNNTTGYFLSQNSVYKTTDRGNSWNITNLGNTLSDIFFINDFTGWVCSSNSIYKTTDGWDSRISIPVSQFGLRNIFFTDSLLGWVSGNNGIISYTTDGGYTWTNQNSGTNSNMSSLFFINSKIGWVLGHQFVNPFLSFASIYKTTNGGITFINIAVSSEIPATFNLSQNYPNPFNPVTEIRFDIPSSEFVTIKIFDALGREISILVNEELKAGKYETSWDASKYPSGIYFYKISSGDFTETRKMILVK